MASARPRKRMKMVVRRGSFGGNKLRRCEVRPHLNPLPGGKEVATLPPFWIPAFAGMTNGGPDWRRDAANDE